MKKIIALILISLCLTLAFSQNMEAFEKDLHAFSTEFASVLSYNATVGNHWADSHIGQLLAVPPHFGVGVAAGFTSIPLDSLKDFFEAAGASVPDALATIGLPIPAAALSLKIGGLILPFDIGIKGMILPASLSSSLAALGFEADYKLLGANLRYLVLKEKTLVPELVVGAGYNRLIGSINMPLGLDAPSYAFDVDGTPHTLALENPNLTMAFTTDSFDFNIQVSKKVLFLRPFLGAALTMGKSQVSSGLKASMTYDDGSGAKEVTAAEITEIKDNLALAGIPVPEIDAAGFLYVADKTDPVFRLYGGISLLAFVVHLDLMAIYVPLTGSFGFNTMLRFQL